MPLHQFTQGTQFSGGIQPVNPVPVDSFSGPYSAGSTTDGISAALDTIPPNLRFLSMEVRILAPNPDVSGQTLAYKYWFRGNTATLEEFSSGDGGAGLDTSNTYTWTAHQNFSAGFSAAGGVTFNSLTHFTAGLSAAGATLGTLVVNSGISAAGGITLNGNLSGATATFSQLTTFTNGISAAGGVTFGNNVQFLQGLSAAGATLGTLVVNGGISASGGVTFNNKLHVEETLTVANSPTQSGTSTIYGNLLMPSTNAQFLMNGTNSSLQVTGLVLVGAKGLEISTGSGISAAGGITFNSLVQFTKGLSASGATLGTLVVNSGISANGGSTFANNVYVGGTLSVNGNFYVAGTMTTVNESQLLIQDKYLVLGSTLGSGGAQYGDSAGIYIGATTGSFASFSYNYNGGGANSHWVSNIPIRIGANEVLTSANLSTQTGLTAESLNVLGTSDSGTYYFPMLSGFASGSAYRVYTEEGISFDANTNTLSCTKIEAIVDGGTW